MDYNYILLTYLIVLLVLNVSRDFKKYKQNITTILVSIVTTFLTAAIIFWSLFGILITDSILQIIMVVIIVSALLVLVIRFTKTEFQNKIYKVMLHTAYINITFIIITFVPAMSILLILSNTNVFAQLISILIVLTGMIYVFFKYLYHRSVPEVLKTIVVSAVIMSSVVLLSNYNNNDSNENYDFGIYQKAHFTEVYSNIVLPFHYESIKVGNYIYIYDTDYSKEVTVYDITNERMVDDLDVIPCYNKAGFALYEDTLYYFTYKLLYIVEGTTFTIIQQEINGDPDEYDFEDAALLYLEDEVLFYYDGRFTYEVQGDQVYLQPDVPKIDESWSSYFSYNLEIVTTRPLTIGEKEYDFNLESEDYTIISKDLILFEQGYYYNGIYERIPPYRTTVLPVDDTLYILDTEFPIDEKSILKFTDYKTNEVISVYSNYSAFLVSFTNDNQMYLMMDKDYENGSSLYTFDGFEGYTLYTSFQEGHSIRYIGTLITTFIISTFVVNMPILYKDKKH